MIYRLIICLLLTGSLPVQATHIIGGHIEVRQTGTAQYDVKLVILRDCGLNNSSLRPVYFIRVFSLSDSSYTTHSFPTRQPQKIAVGDTCFSPPDLCMERYEVSGSIYLPPDPKGYLFVAQAFARNYSIENIYADVWNQTGMTWVTELRTQGSSSNSSPELPMLSGNSFLCLNYLRELDMSATDPDGDSLAYHLEVPYGSGPGANNNQFQPLPDPPPYQPVNWRPGYGINKVITGNPPLSIDPVTGLLSVRPDKTGIYVLTYAVSEYRNGVKIGEVRRDIQLEVLHCQINEAPVFTEPTVTIYSTEVNREKCISVVVQDPNSDDTIEVKTAYTFSLQNPEATPNLSLINRTDTGSAGGQVCWTPSCDESFAGQQLEFDIRAVSHGCDRTDTIYKRISFNVDPLPADIEKLFPNVFTPNEDGINDIFRLQNEFVYPCLSDLRIRIFNRWGLEVYENRLSYKFGWDGTYKGKEVAQGTYYYIVSGNYGKQGFEHKGFLSLLR